MTLQKELLKLERHRKFQLVITFGTVLTAVLSITAPDLAHYSVAGSVITNLIWIWE